MIVTFRTDKPEAEIGLYEGSQQLDYYTWTAHRVLAETIHLKVKAMLDKHGMSYADITGIVCFEGPGSFTGLRIGLTVANTLAYALQVPIIGAQGDDWIKTGIARLNVGDDDRQIIPFYGAAVHITPQKK
jgi:tRNA threonylcarbamoyladenosine biosynthesis protein TsaB